MGVMINTNGKYKGNQTIILENELLQVVIMPKLGAKIWQIIYKPLAKEMLWNHPDLQPQNVQSHSDFEVSFFGGWDELFPNDMPEQLNGKAQPDHGEIWSLPWEFSIECRSENEVAIHLWVYTKVSSCKVEKWISLRLGDSKLHFHHKITNLSTVDQPFLWKLHPALIIDEDCRVDLGARKMVLEAIGNPRKEAQYGEYDWPYMMDRTGAKQDMRRMLSPNTKVKEIQYAKEMLSGWCALTHVKERIGFGLIFDLQVFPTLYLFSSFGGWGDQQMIIMEPCTGYPLHVNEGIKQGTHQILKAGQSLETDITAVVYEGVASVSSIDSEGNIS